MLLQFEISFFFFKREHHCNDKLTIPRKIRAQFGQSSSHGVIQMISLDYNLQYIYFSYHICK